MIDAFFIYFLNAVSLEFGDEVFCLFLSYNEIETWRDCRSNVLTYFHYSENNHTAAAVLGAVLGYSVAPTSILYYGINGKPNTASGVFGSIMAIEFIEGLISAVGQLANELILLPALLVLALSLVAGFIRGVVSAFLFEWNKSSGFKFVVTTIACVVIVGFGNYMGIFDSKNQLNKNSGSNSTNDTASPTVSTPRVAQPIIREGVCFRNSSTTQVSIKVKFLSPENRWSNWSYFEPGQTLRFFRSYPDNSTGRKKIRVRFGTPIVGDGPTVETITTMVFSGAASCENGNTYQFIDDRMGVELQRPQIVRRYSQHPIFSAEELDLYAERKPLKLHVFHSKPISYDIREAELDALNSRLYIIFNSGMVADIGPKIQCLLFPYFLRGDSLHITRTENKEVQEKTIIPLRIVNLTHLWELPRRDNGASKIGIIMSPLSSDIRQRFGWFKTGGVLVSKVTGDPAKSASLLKDDIIQKVNGRIVESPNELQSCITLTKPDTTLIFEVFRKGRTLTYQVKARDWL